MFYGLFSVQIFLWKLLAFSGISAKSPNNWRNVRSASRIPAQICSWVTHISPPPIVRGMVVDALAFWCRSFLHFLAPATTTRATSHLPLCPADSAPSVGKSPPADPGPPRIAPGMSRPPRSSGRAPGRSSLAPPEPTSFQAERAGGEGSVKDANEMNEASTGVKLQRRAQEPQLPASTKYQNGTKMCRARPNMSSIPRTFASSPSGTFRVIWLRGKTLAVNGLLPRRR